MGTAFMSDIACASGEDMHGVYQGDQRRLIFVSQSCLEVNVPSNIEQDRKANKREQSCIRDIKHLL